MRMDFELAQYNDPVGDLMGEQELLPLLKAHICLEGVTFGAGPEGIPCAEDGAESVGKLALAEPCQGDDVIAGPCPAPEGCAAVGAFHEGVGAEPGDVHLIDFGAFEL